jgi:CRISPR-associated protein Cas2
MARPTFLYVFAYDIEKNSARRAVSDLLGEHLRRVQQSVFEGYLSEPAAQRLARRASERLGQTDSLRVYSISADGIDRSMAFGALPMAEKHDFLIL